MDLTRSSVGLGTRSRSQWKAKAAQLCASPRLLLWVEVGGGNAVPCCMGLDLSRTFLGRKPFLHRWIDIARFVCA
jgi:hypothetical protein